MILLSFPLFLAYEANRSRIEKFFDKKERVYFFGLIVLVLSSVFIFSSKFSEIIETEKEAVYLLAFKILFFGVFFLTLLGKHYKKLGVVLAIFILATFSFVGGSVVYTSYGVDKEELFEFIKIDTYEDSVFLVPPYMNSFRLGAERAVVVDYNFPFGEKSMVEWYSRIKDVTNGVETNLEEDRISELKKGYDSLEGEDVLELKREYDFEYAVFEKEKEFDFEEVFQNDRFIVYRV